MPLHNNLDNAGFYNQVIISDPILSRLITRFIDSGPFLGLVWSNPIIPAMCHIISYVRYRRAGVEDPDIIKVRAAALAECLGPALPDDMYARQDVARERIRIIGTWLRQHHDAIGDLTSASLANYGETRDFLRTRPAGMNFILDDIPDDLPVIPEDGDDVPLTLALILIIHAAHHATEWVTNYNLSSLAHLHIAVAKQGNVTTRFLTKVRQGIYTDLQVQLDLSPAFITLFWNAFRSGISDDNVRELFRHWGEWIPASALRMRLVVQQTALTGLTVLSAIGKAMKLHPNFSWGDIMTYLPVESQAYRDAVALVGDNQYYGYRKDLGNVVSTKYKSLGYVAWQLLSRASGITTMNGYKGWPRNIPFKGEIDTLIDEYVDGRGAEILGPAERQQGEALKDEIMNIVNDRDNANIYA